jgi:hypothetical protein
MNDITFVRICTKQRWPSPVMSVIDLLFNVGSSALRILLEGNSAAKRAVVSSPGAVPRCLGNWHRRTDNA